jgi:cell division protein FtsB
MSAGGYPYVTVSNPYAESESQYVMSGQINQDHLVEIISTLIRDTVRLSGENARLQRDNDHLRRQIRTLNEPALIRRSPAVESFMDLDDGKK